MDFGATYSLNAALIEASTNPLIRGILTRFGACFESGTHEILAFGAPRKVNVQRLKKGGSGVS